MARLAEKYKKEIVPAFMSAHGCKNMYQVPKLKKVVVNVGFGSKAQDNKVMESIGEGLAKITGQKPALRRAKKAISGFKLKPNQPCGYVVTLRSARMYEFLDRLINIAIPRIRDFQGLSNKSFDEAGNHTFGLTEQVIFPEVDMDKAQLSHGMDITVVINSGDMKASLDLLKLFGFPFKKK